MFTSNVMMLKSHTQAAYKTNNDDDFEPQPPVYAVQYDLYISIFFPMMAQVSRRAKISGCRLKRGYNFSMEWLKVSRLSSYEKPP